MFGFLNINSNKLLKNFFISIDFEVFETQFLTNKSKAY